MYDAARFVAGSILFEFVVLPFYLWLIFGIEYLSIVARVCV